MFMRPQITMKDVWVDVEKDGESTVVPVDCFDIGDWMKVGESFEVTKVEGFGARMSAPGYMDCTDWCVFDTEMEAAAHLADLHYDGPLDEYSREELEDLIYLVGLAGYTDTKGMLEEMLEKHTA